MDIGRALSQRKCESIRRRSNTSDHHEVGLSVTLLHVGLASSIYLRLCLQDCDSAELSIRWTRLARASAGGLLLWLPA